MERVVRLFNPEDEAVERLAYWLSRPPAERLAEVERLRREYYRNIRGEPADGPSSRLQRTLRLVEREER
jgi:hypothetical protein